MVWGRRSGARLGAPMAMILVAGRRLRADVVSPELFMSSSLGGWSGAWRARQVDPVTLSGTRVGKHAGIQGADAMRHFGSLSAVLRTGKLAEADVKWMGRWQTAMLASCHPLGRQTGTEEGRGTSPDSHHRCHAETA